MGKKYLSSIFFEYTPRDGAYSPQKFIRLCVIRGFYVNLPLEKSHRETSHHMPTLL